MKSSWYCGPRVPILPQSPRPEWPMTPLICRHTKPSPAVEMPVFRYTPRGTGCQEFCPNLQETRNPSWGRPLP